MYQTNIKLRNIHFTNLYPERRSDEAITVRWRGNTIMLKNLIIGSLLLAGASASADGFICRAVGENLNVTVYNSTKAPRLAHVMIVSDPTIAYGRQTIARFFRETGTLTNRGASFVGIVDPNQPDTSRAGENIAGTKLGQLKEMALTVDFSYARPVAEGEELEGLLVLTKRSGDVIDVRMECLRYLKGE